MDAGKMELLPWEGVKVRGCPGKRLLSLVILPNDDDRAVGPLRGTLDRDCLSKLDILCRKACKYLNNRIQKAHQTSLYASMLKHCSRLYGHEEE